MAINSADERQARLGKNEALFRSVNERVAAISATHSTYGPLRFMCECGDAACGQRLELTRPEFEEIRAEPTYFFVLPGHVIPDIEVVVKNYGRYLIVKKIGAAAGVALVTDARGLAGPENRLRTVAQVTKRLETMTHLTLVPRQDTFCEACEGSGRVSAPAAYATAENPEQVPCHACGGTGHERIEGNPRQHPAAVIN